MEADHTTADDPPEGSKEVDKEDPGNWRTRLRLKQVAVQLPLMQNVDGEYSPEEAEESHEKNKAQTARKSFKRPPLRGQETPPGASISGKILRFSCSECMGQAMFSPNDLLKHFQGVHQGSLPTFPCDMCSFVTHDFSSLQRHRIGHRDTFVRCEICNDSVQYTLLQLTRHFNIFHSLNGYYRCEKCKFSTKDVGTFVQHTHRHNDPQYKCSKCQHVSHSNGEYQKHVLTHAGTYPFTCQLCDYGAPRKDYITKHMATVHGDEMERRTRRSAGEDGPKTLVNSSPGLKLLLTKNPARQTHWMSKGLHALSGGGLLDEFGRLTNPEKTLEETQQFLERTVAAQRDCKKWAKALKTDQQYASQTIPTLSQPKQEAAVTPNTSFLNPNSNGLTVLMVKNKITIPPNCTTKVMGFKMVDGKKHLVLKVIPSGKQESSPKTPESAAASSTSSVAEKDADSQTAETCTEDTHSPVHSEEGTAPLSSQPDLSNAEASPNSTSLCSPLSQQETSTKENDDATSPETSEETGVQKNGDENGQHESPSQAGEAEEQQLPEEENSNKGPATSPTTDSVCPIMDEMEHSSPLKGEDTSQPNGNTSSPESVPDQPGSEMETPLESADPKEMDVSLTCPENIDDDNMSSKSALNSPNQEVFTFHNYSKDTSSLSSDTSLPGDDELVMEDPENDSSQISRASSDGTLKLADLPEQELQDCQEDEVGFTHSPNQDIQDTQSPMGSDLPSMEKVPDSEIEVDECIATVEEEEAPQQVSGMCQTPESPQKSKTALETASPSSEQQMEPLGCDDSVETGTNTKDTSASEPQDHAAKSTEKIDSSGGEKSTASSSNAAMLGKILEQHSDAIISQQLEKERIGTTLNHEVIRTPTTTLRILQPLNLTEGTKTSGSSSQDSIQAAASPLLSLSSPTPVQGKDQRKEREEGLVCKLKKARLPHPRMNHQTPKRKRQTKPSVEDVVEPASKARRLSSKKSKEKEGPTVVHWEPVPRDVERTLRLLPFSPGQLIKCPRRNQPVVVLNHPDADIPEVASLMRTVNKFRGEVMKVALSQRTVDALSELDCDTFKQNCSANCHASHGRRVRPQGTVRERFILKLRLKKTSRNKYKVVNTISEGTEQPLTFNCWFCGRVFGNQEEWIGHGQRHLMEATRDWNKLF
ncbi:zinc finger protein 518A isoform X2 [Megalops cyprinoides]|uniref:zinc finger protein 518A isoform X2 n=1 Tax=Megalops cyprinoides TaxID=118141 RepID=UPI001863AD85|nr:zinc finger protein 518A isoform X2 [Megalops cyprinoides]